MNYREVDLYFNNLNERGKKKALEAAGVNDPKEMNWDIDIFPIATLCFEDENEVSE